MVQGKGVDMTDVTKLNTDEKRQVSQAIQEAAVLKHRQKELGEQIKDIVDFINEKFEINKRDIRWAITTAFKDNYLEEFADFTRREYLYEDVVNPE